jgi:vacuolar-type H+-ATPase subunit H
MWWAFCMHNSNLTKSGFIQIPLLIGTIFILSIAASRYIGAKYINLNKTDTNKAQKEELGVHPETSEQSVLTKEIEPPKVIKSSPKVIPSAMIDTSISQTNLKIEQCKATKEVTYNAAVLKINQAISSRLEEVFNSINKQTEDEAQKINNDKNTKITNLKDNYVFYTSYYNGIAEKQLDSLYKNQQSFWYAQKREIESEKQKAIDQVNLLLGEEYNKCLDK